MCYLSAVCSLILVVLTLFAVLVRQTNRKAHAYFDSRGVLYRRPWPLVGNLFRLICGWQSGPDLMFSFYSEAKDHGIYGCYNFTEPNFIVADLEAIRSITVTDYAHFLDHRPVMGNADTMDPIFGKSLFMLNGDRWRDMRTTLTPAFTGAKLRRMMPLVIDVCEQYMQTLRTDAIKSAARGEPLEIETKDLMKRYMVDVIASTAFGYKVDSWQQRSNRIYTTAMDMMHFNTGWNMLKLSLSRMCPVIMRLVGIRLIRPEHVRFYHDLVHGTMAYRERKGIRRPDMIQLLAEARKGFLKYEQDQHGDQDRFAFGGETGAEDVRGMQKRYWDESDVTAQCFLFFSAGAENASTLLAFVTQELMENPHVQDRLRVELDELRRRQTDGQAKKLLFDSLMSSPYLDMVVLETLRKWPTMIMLDRRCVQDYTLRLSTGQTVQMRAGDVITIPVLGIHRDERFYADPDRFDPERFNEERRKQIRPFTYLAMGMGLRNCIGWRYAMMAVKVLLFHVLAEFTLEVCPRSSTPAETAASGMLLRVKGGSWMEMRRRNE